APLSPIWTALPVGRFKIKVIGISKKGDSLGLAGKGKYYHASWFDPPDNGVYLEPVMPYDSSGMLALYKDMHKPYVSYWLKNKKPDHAYQFYRYAAKIFGSLIAGAVFYAKVHQDSEEARRARKIAII